MFYSKYKSNYKQMKCLSILFIFSVMGISVFAQQTDKFAMLGKAGYAGSTINAFYGGLSFEYMFWKRLGVVAGFGQIYGNTFPKKSGRINTGAWRKEEQDPTDSNGGDLYYYTHDKLFTEGSSFSYNSFSALSVVFGAVFYALSNENNIIAISLGGNYSWQLYGSYYTRALGSEEALLGTDYTRFAGMMFMGGITYRRRVYKSFWAGAYLQISPFDKGDYNSKDGSGGIELSVRF